MFRPDAAAREALPRIEGSSPRRACETLGIQQMGDPNDQEQDRTGGDSALSWRSRPSESRVTRATAATTAPSRDSLRRTPTHRAQDMGRSALLARTTTSPAARMVSRPGSTTPACAATRRAARLIRRARRGIRIAREPRQPRGSRAGLSGRRTPRAARSRPRPRTSRPKTECLYRQAETCCSCTRRPCAGHPRFRRT